MEITLFCIHIGRSKAKNMRAGMLLSQPLRGGAAVTDKAQSRQKQHEAAAAIAEGLHLRRLSAGIEESTLAAEL